MSKKQYNNAVNSIYPFVNSFTHKEIKISVKELKLIQKRLRILEQFYIDKTNKKSDIHIENIFNRLQIFVKEIFNIAIKEMK